MEIHEITFFQLSASFTAVMRAQRGKKNNFEISCVEKLFPNLAENCMLM